MMLLTPIVVLDETPLDVSVGNTTVETTLYKKPIPGGSLGTSDKVRLDLLSKVRRGENSASTLTLRFKYGETIVVAVRNIAPTSEDFISDLLIHFELVGKGSTNFQLGYARSGLQQSECSFGAKSGIATEDSNTERLLIVTAQWSDIGGPGQEIAVRGAVLELLKCEPREMGADSKT